MNPTIFKYPAILCSVFVLGTKMVAVVVHTQEVKNFSRRITMAECTLESSPQLQLLLHIWLSGGQLYLGAIISSVIVIGKNSAENILINGTVNKLAGKTLGQRVALVASYTPVMALNTLFRVGSSALVLYHPDLLLPLSPTFSMFLTWAYLCLWLPLIFLLLTSLKPWVASLGKLTTMELGQALINECSTVTVWGNLGREGSRGLQLGMATYHVLLNCSYITWQCTLGSSVLGLEHVL